MDAEMKVTGGSPVFFLAGAAVFLAGALMALGALLGAGAALAGAAFLVVFFMVVFCFKLKV
jgi:hypothetical protein